MSDSSATVGDTSAGWSDYYQRTAYRPPRRTTLTALAALRGLGNAGDAEREVFAVDLGCGGGRDAAPLLEDGLAVLAIDRKPEAGAALRTRFPAAWTKRQLTFRRADFARRTFRLPQACLVNASFCLPACPPGSFARLWSLIARAVSPQGLFAGHLYGPNDSWARRGDVLSVHTRCAVEAILANWQPILFEEEETDSVTPRGSAKHWHIFHIVARKRN